MERCKVSVQRAREKEEKKKKERTHEQIRLLQKKDRFVCDTRYHELPWFSTTIFVYIQPLAGDHTLSDGVSINTDPLQRVRGSHTQKAYQRWYVFIIRTARMRPPFNRGGFAFWVGWV